MKKYQQHIKKVKELEIREKEIKDNHEKHLKESIEFRDGLINELYDNEELISLLKVENCSPKGWTRG